MNGFSFYRYFCISLTIFKMFNMKKELKALLLTLPFACSLVSCINNDYDLSDIDTTVGIAVNDLVIPVNLDKITLGDVLDLEDDSQIKEVNGIYAVVKDGTFSSDEIEIPSFSAPAPSIEPISSVLSIEVESFAKASLRTGNKVAKYPITEANTSFMYHSDDVSEYIIAAYAFDLNSSLNVDIIINGLDGITNSFEIENLSIQLPAGMKAVSDKGVYDEETGVLNLGNVTGQNNRFSFKVDFSRVDVEKSGAVLKDGKFDFSGEISVKTGDIAIYDDNFESGMTVADLPEEVEFKGNATMSDMSVSTFDGVVCYNIDGIDVDPISMTDIPDILNQTGTNIILDNPQIYVSMNNPVADKGLSASVGFALTPIREGETSQALTLDDDSLVIGHDKPLNENYTFCMSPYKPDTYYTGFEDAEFCEFSTLGKVLSGTKLPESINIDVVNPNVWAQEVYGFELGQKLDRVNGTYSFYAPLALTDNSVIAYKDTIDGWNDEDVDSIEISEAIINAVVTTDVPLALDIKAEPIDKYGNVIENVEVKGASVGIKADGQPIEISIKGKIRHLDGIILTARAQSGVSDESLAPGHNISLTDIKAKVSGIYRTEL